MSIDTENHTPQPRARLRRPVDTTEPVIPRTPAPPRVRGRRNPRWMALGVVAICLGGLLSYVIYAKVAVQTAVVAMARTVHRGAVISATDLTTATVGGTSKLSTVPAGRLPDLVGHRVAYDLVEGALVPAAAVADVPVPDAGRAIVGLKLSQGRAPAALLDPSAPVRLVALPSSDQPANAAEAFAKAAG